MKLANPIFSNGRKLTKEELLLIHMTASFPESPSEPTEMTQIRRNAESAYQAAVDVPGAILDSMDYEYLKLVV